MTATPDTRRVVAITGAGGALGSAISARLAGEPTTDLVLSDVSDTSLDATVAALPDARGGVATQLADVSDPGQVEALVKLAVERFGRLDALISNAGVLSPNGRIHNLATEDWERAFRINVLGAVNGITAAVGVMRPQGSGSIVLTASPEALAWARDADPDQVGVVLTVVVFLVLAWGDVVELALESSTMWGGRRTSAA